MIGKDALDLDRSGLDVDFPVGDIEVARTRIDSAVGEDHLESRLALGDPLLLMLLDPGRKMEILALADRKGDFDRVELRDRREQRGGADQVADLGLGDSSDTVDR